MTYHVILPVIIAFAVSALLGPVVIPFLRRFESWSDGAERA